MKIMIVSMKVFGAKNSIIHSIMEDYFDKPIISLGHEIFHYDFMERFLNIGKKAMNDELKDAVKGFRPDYTIFVPFQNEFFPETITVINSITTTIGYFFDDTWRINYSLFWSKYYNYVTTSSINGLRLWNSRNCNNFIYSPFACNLNVFKKTIQKKIYDVSFVGGYHPYRAWYIRKLRRAGIDVNVWGNGWPSGEISQEQMVYIFNQSKINLNLSNNESFDIRFIFDLSRPFIETLKVFKKTFLTLIGSDVKIIEMVKARHFEISACGAFQLTFYVEGIEHHFDIGREIVVYQNIYDIIEKIKYFLKHEDEREKIANNALTRSVKDHSLEIRFKKLFEDLTH